MRLDFLLVNAGTWSRLTPRGAGPEARFGYVEIDAPNGGAPVARLRRWDGASAP